MQENEEGWIELCKQAAVEQDHDKLIKLSRQINELLLKKLRRQDGE